MVFGRPDTNNWEIPGQPFDESSLNGQPESVETATQ